MISKAFVFFFGALALGQREEMSALETLYSGQFTL